MERALLTVEMPILLGEKKKLVLSQGWHGPYHGRICSPMELDHAVDIATPVGTIVQAARAGVVRGLSMASNRFSRDLDLSPADIDRWTRYCTNWILLEHGDGIQTLYAHLMSESQCVETGQRVRAGEHLARTGLSGWVGDIDNLHFQVQEWRGRNVTLPFRFAGYKGPMEHADLFPSPSSSVA
ncbi:MAG: M23 family metallopeptidase [Candidatus Peribacteraceae bacterium]|nr:M23 family metallopeptidase [Candidatus Peribacteraceae bacterium]